MIEFKTFILKCNYSKCANHSMLLAFYRSQPADKTKKTNKLTTFTNNKSWFCLPFLYCFCTLCLLFLYCLFTSPVPLVNPWFTV